MEKHERTNILIDRFARYHTYLRISLTDRCNLRCTYCMPEHGIDLAPAAHLLQDDEIVRLASIFATHGVNKIRLTGGEPLLRRNLPALVSRLALIPGIKILAMTTNGIGLSEKAKPLRDAGLTHLTVSLDSLDRERYALITRRDRINDALAGIDASLEAGFSKLKINCVLMRGINDDEITDFVAWAAPRKVEMRFIEYMPFPDTDWHEAGVLSYHEMIERIQERYTLVPMIDEKNAVGKSFAVEGLGTKVSFISSMSDSFCGSCNRLRLTADGQIKSCLFHPSEYSLRDLLREGADNNRLEEIISDAVWMKQASHAPMEKLLSVKNRNMVAIGG